MSTTIRLGDRTPSQSREPRVTIPEAAESTPLARLDCLVRVAIRLFLAAERTELLTIAGAVIAATAAAWPAPASVYPYVAIPAVLLLATLIRVNADSLDSRRQALASAGANPTDTRIITAVCPLAASAAGATAGIAASIATGHPHAAGHALLPLLVVVIAMIVLRPKWIGAPALAAGTAAASVAAVAVTLSVPTGAGTSTALVASTTSAAARAAAAGAEWNYASLPAVAAVLVLVAAQVAGRKLNARSRA
jgi:hypothetical protein